MPESNVKFLDAVVSWHGRNANALPPQVLVQLVGPTAGDNKNSVGLEFTAPSLAATVEVWDSGECEVIASEMDDPEGDPAVSVLELADPNEVGDVLAHVVAQLAAQ